MLTRAYTYALMLSCRWRLSISTFYVLRLRLRISVLCNSVNIIVIIFTNSNYLSLRIRVGEPHSSQWTDYIIIVTWQALAIVYCCLLFVALLIFSFVINGFIEISFTRHSTNTVRFNVSWTLYLAYIFWGDEKDITNYSGCIATFSFSITL